MKYVTYVSGLQWKNGFLQMRSITLKDGEQYEESEWENVPAAQSSNNTVGSDPTYPNGI